MQRLIKRWLNLRERVRDYAALFASLVRWVLGGTAEYPPQIQLRASRLLIWGRPLADVTVVERLGVGANGVVFRITNDALRREEALKVWLTLRKGDQRDKAVQAIEEARKQAAAVGDQVVSIHSVQKVRGYVIARMQYVRGHNLKEHLKQFPEDRAEMLWKYLHLMVETTKPRIYHGDPHIGNVLVFWNDKDKYQKHWELMLCDFGTSHFAEDRNAGKARHWEKMRETARALLKPLPEYSFCWDAFERAEEGVKSQIERVLRDPAPHLTDHDREELEVMLRLAPYRDLATDVRDLTFARLDGKPAG